MEQLTVGISKVAIFMNLVSVTSMVSATIENIPPSHAQILGAILVISAVTFSSLSQTKSSSSWEAESIVQLECSINKNFDHG